MTSCAGRLGFSQVYAAALACAACVACATGGAAAERAGKLAVVAAGDRAASARAAAEPVRAQVSTLTDGVAAPEAPRDEVRERAQRELGGPSQARDMDPEVLSLLDAIDRAQVEQGMQARTHAADPRVRALTERLVLAHAGFIARREGLGQRLSLRPRESPRSARVSAESNATLARLGRLRGPAWDRAYLSALSAEHGQCLSLIDRLLVPVVTAPALRAMLVDEVRPSVARDLELAEALRAELERP